MPGAYYNEFDEQAAAWLRELIKQGHIADGEVDTRSISDVAPDDLRGFTQCHFFAGIGGWPRALRLAQWPDTRPVWTGSCPCQPFSVAGRSGGFADERHLWPHFHWLIAQRGPSTVFGEQVASGPALDWFDLVRDDLEASGYAVGAADLCAAGVGAPQIRQRLYWVADAQHGGCGAGIQEGARSGSALPPGAARGVASSSSTRLEGRDAGALGHQRAAAERGGSAGGVADAEHDGCGRAQGDAPEPSGHGACHRISDGSGGGLRGTHMPRPTDGFWRAADWLGCRDGSWRPVEPGTFPLAHGLPARVGRLRGYGNAIVPQVAAAFVRAAQ